MDSSFTAAVGPTHLLTSRILNGPDFTISTAVPSHSSHALKPYSCFALSSDSYAAIHCPLETASLAHPHSCHLATPTLLTVALNFSLTHSVSALTDCPPSPSHITVDGQSTSLSRCRAPSGAHDQILLCHRSVTVLCLVGRPI
jgi:hypothetical protein